MKVFSLTHPTQKRIPIVVSVPHCGTQFPEDIRDQFNQERIKDPSDTDWFVDKLYDFVPALGITLMTASFSRWVIDLNRDPENKPLYSDGRIITALCPTQTFLGEPLYSDRRMEVDEQEVKRRHQQYYVPYHQQLQVLLDNLKAEFGKVLLWDCHSVKQYVPTIYKEKFPDLILGDADGSSASSDLINIASQQLGASSYSLTHNHPFKGGYITRYFGKPLRNQHALQLEMSKVNYMDDSENLYHPLKADKMRTHLTKTFSALAKSLLN
jgi:N-formylglutamate deformylase